MKGIIKFDETSLKAALAAIDDVAKRHVPFAVSVAFNRTGEEILAKARAEIPARMTVRVPGFVLPPVQLPRTARATPKLLEMEAALGYPDVSSQSIGARREKILRKFEYGGIKQASNPSFPIAIPSSALRPTPQSTIPRALYPVNLRLAPRKNPEGTTLPGLRRGKVRTLTGGAVGSRKKRRELGLEGIGGTFTIVDSETGAPLGVFQRVGRDRSQVRVLWWFEEKIRIPRLLEFTNWAHGIVDGRLTTNFEGAMELALRTAK